MCNYNYADYLEQATKSVLAQTYQNLQLIVVDDGSTDSSGSILNSILDVRVEVIFQKNMGQASAFNAGLDRCRGKFVAFLDSDDYWYPNKLAIVIPEFSKGNFSLVQHNLDRVGSNSEPLEGVHPGFAAGSLSLETSYLAQNHTGFFCPTSGLVCRKSDLDQIFPINDNWVICADVAFTRPLPLFGDILTLSEQLGAYRIHGKNSWMNSSAQAKFVQNHQLYVDYANEWLMRHGVRQKLEFKKSKLHHIYSKSAASQNHLAARFGALIKSAIKRIPGAKKLYSMVRS